MSEDEGSSGSSGAKVFPKREIVAGNRGRAVQEGEMTYEDKGDDKGDERCTNTAEEMELAYRMQVDRDRDVTEANSNEEKHEPERRPGDGAGGSTGAADASVEGPQGGENSSGQQIFENTQLETMDVETGEGAPAGTSTTTASERLNDGSYGDGKVQADLAGWLK